MKIRCLLIDDEPIAREILEAYIEKAEYLELVGSCSSAIEAYVYIQNQNIDLIFLDIQMPEITGLQFLTTLVNPPKVILTTAYREFAADSYELNVVDYLVKPVSFERFMKAINKALSGNIAVAVKANDSIDEEQFIFIREERKLVRIYLSEINYLESQRDYVIVSTADRLVKTRHTLQYFEELLPKKNFVRIHRSFIVAISKVKSVSDHKVEVGGKELAIGGNYREEILFRLNIKTN